MPVYAADFISNSTIDEAALLTHYPNAKIIHVDVAAYQQLAEQLRNQGYTSTAVAPVMQLAKTEPNVLTTNRAIYSNPMTLSRDFIQKRNYFSGSWNSIPG